jgi:hypothetical protein
MAQNAGWRSDERPGATALRYGKRSCTPEIPEIRKNGPKKVDNIFPAA